MSDCQIPYIQVVDLNKFSLVSPLSSLLSPLTIGLDLILLPSIELIQAGLALSELSQMGGENNLPIKLS